jgi:hypothetical protein
VQPKACANKLTTLYKIFWTSRKQQFPDTSELWTDTAVFVQGIRSNQVGLFYDVSTRSEHYILFPFMPSGYQRERAGKIFQIGYIEELLSFSMDVKTDFVHLLFDLICLR